MFLTSRGGTLVVAKGRRMDYQFVQGPRMVGHVSGTADYAPESQPWMSDDDAMGTEDSASRRVAKFLEPNPVACGPNVNEVNGRGSRWVREGGRLQSVME